MLGVGIPGGYSRVAATRVIIQSCISNRESMPNHCVCSDTGGVPGEPSYTPAPSRRSWRCVACAVSQSVSPRSLVPDRGGVAAPRVSDRVSDSGDRPARVGRRPRLCARARGRGGAVRWLERREISAGRMRDGV